MSGTVPVDIQADGLVPLPEAAALLGVTPDAVRARIRRGLLRGRKGNRTWLVELPVGVRSATEWQPDNDRTFPVTPDDNDGLAAARLEELRAALAAEQVARARAEGALEAETRRCADMAATLAAEREAHRLLLDQERARGEAALTVERARADRLEAALAEARRPLLLRLLDGLRRKG